MILLDRWVATLLETAMPEGLPNKLRSTIEVELKCSTTYEMRSGGDAETDYDYDD